MPAKYKLNDEQYFMLTYPTIPDGFDTQLLIDVLERLGCNYRIGRELHQDGKPHLHAMLCFDEPYTDGDARTTFKIGTRVPNIRVRRVKPERGWDYVGNTSLWCRTSTRVSEGLSGASLLFLSATETRGTRLDWTITTRARLNGIGWRKTVCSTNCESLSFVPV